MLQVSLTRCISYQRSLGIISVCIQVSAGKITEMEDRLENEESEANPIFEEYFHYVMENNSLQHPSSIHDAGVLFEKLTQFACAN